MARLVAGLSAEIEGGSWHKSKFVSIGPSVKLIWLGFHAWPVHGLGGYIVWLV